MHVCTAGSKSLVSHNTLNHALKTSLFAAMWPCVTRRFQGRRPSDLQKDRCGSWHRTRYGGEASGCTVWLPYAAKLLAKPMPASQANRPSLGSSGLASML